MEREDIYHLREQRKLCLVKIPVVVAKKIERNKREFVWEGNEEKAGMHPINWGECPKPHGGGGLEGKELALLSKW